MSVKTLAVACPTCTKEVLMVEGSKYRPFCSHRCQLIDFGAWAEEENRLPAEHAEETMWSEQDPKSYD